MRSDCHGLYNALGAYAQWICVVLQHIACDAMSQYEIEELACAIERTVRRYAAGMRARFDASEFIGRKAPCINDNRVHFHAKVHG